MSGRRELGAVLPRRIRPFIDPDNEAFWTGGAEGRLLIRHCADCGLWIHPAFPRCRRCGSAEVPPEAVSGRGRVATYALNVHPWMPGAEPFIIALVELDEQKGLFLTTNLIDVDVEDVQIGTVVDVVFEPDPDRDIFYPLFRPV